MLGHEADVLKNFHTFTPRVTFQDPELSLMFVLSEQRADEGGLAGTILSNEGNSVSVLDLEIQPVQHLLTLEALADLK
jgi:hypothetical protein